jgi:peptidoglycan-associated lipoprotein
MTALLLGGTAAAQSPGTLLIGGFGQYQYFNDQNRENNFEFDRLGWGGRVGAYITPQLNLEADGMYAPIARSEGARDEKYSAIAARLMYNFPIGNVPSFHIGAGGVLKNIRFADPPMLGSTYNYGVEGAAGVNLGFGGFALRFDVLGDYFPEPSNFDIRVQAGVQFSPDLASMFSGGGMTSSSSTLWAPIVWWDEMDAPLPGTVEIGGFGQWTMFDDNAGRTGSVPKDGLGYGGRVGVFLSDPRFQIEGDGYYSPHDNDDETPGAGQATDIDASAFALRLNYNFPLGNLMGRQSQFIIGGGAVRTNYKFEGLAANQVPYTYNYGASGLVGLRLGVANRTAIRIDGVVDYMPNHEPDANMNLHARAGLSLLLGGGRPEAMCTYPGLESIPASSPNCVAPPPPPPPPPPAPCPYDASITATDPRCVAPVAVVVDTAAITGPIYFDFDKSTIRPDAAATLDRKIPYLQANPGMRIRIEGNADERGSDEYNLALGQRRAASAKRYLVERGIAADRFDLVSYGEERPVCTEHNEACWQQNRRDDFRIVTIGGDGVIRVP